ncbi:GNAT family N-acetyltransferase [Nocardia suismassiliense]|uniref:GNAT family N-acetyltransferase n=1 Tax=Nocardia suismassiliense TaxID=2077092 RepID=UPI000D1DD945|nr:GNAT family N-acetyltransferase [Nocardia suismassiliense]
MLVRPAIATDLDTIATLLTESWSSTTVIAHGTSYDASQLPALLAERDGRPVGLLTYTLGSDSLEIVTLDASEQHIGIGTALFSAAVECAREAGARRVWLVTTNDNLDALRFYQRRGMRISAVTPGAVDSARTRKSSIPDIGNYGIEIHDELILEMMI